MIASVGPDEYNQYVGWFLEFGIGYVNEARYWGQPGEPTSREGIAFMRRAQTSTAAAQQIAIARHVRDNWHKA